MTDCSYTGFGTWLTGCGIRITSYDIRMSGGVRVTSCDIRMSGFDIGLTGFVIWITGGIASSMYISEIRTRGPIL